MPSIVPAGIGDTALGVGFRPPFADWLMEGPALVDFVELTAEHYFDHPERAAAIAEVHPVVVHGLGMSIGSPDEDADWLARFGAVCRATGPRWVSDHLAFTRAAGLDLGHLNPLSLDEAMLERVAARADRLQQRLGCRFLLENITSHLLVPGTITEPDFLTRVAERTGGGVLLDVTNLYVNATNHGFDPLDWLARLDPGHVIQYHIVGFARVGERLEDLHNGPVQTELLRFARKVVDVIGARPLLLEWDRDHLGTPALIANLLELEQLYGCDGAAGDAAHTASAAGCVSR